MKAPTQKEVAPFVKNHMKESAAIRQSAEKAVVDDHASYETVSDVLLTVKERLKLIDAAMAKWIDPAKEIINHTKALFAETVKDYEETEAILKEKLGRYIVSCEEARLEMMRKSLKAASPSTRREMVATADKLSAPAVSGISAKPKLQWEVVDASKVPDKYFTKVIDEAKLETDLLEGVEVSGVSVFPHVTISVTPSRRAK